MLPVPAGCLLRLRSDRIRDDPTFPENPPLILVMVQFLRTSKGRWANSKAKGPALGLRSPSTAVMLMALGSGFSHISAS